MFHFFPDYSVIIRIVKSRFWSQIASIFRWGIETPAYGKEIKETGETSLFAWFFLNFNSNYWKFLPTRLGTEHWISEICKFLENRLLQNFK